MEKLITIIVAVIGILPPLLAWGSELTLRGKRRQQLNEIKSRIDVLDAWIKTWKSFPGQEDDNEQLSKCKYELTKLFDQYNNILNREQSLAAAGLTEIGFFRRAFLIYPSKGIKELLFHVAFYIILVLFSVMLIGISIPGPGADPSIQYLFGNPSLLLGIIPFVIILLLLQQFSESSRKKYKGVIS